MQSSGFTEQQNIVGLFKRIQEKRGSPSHEFVHDRLDPQNPAQILTVRIDPEREVCLDLRDTMMDVKKPEYSAHLLRLFKTRGYLSPAELKQFRKSILEDVKVGPDPKPIDGKKSTEISRSNPTSNPEVLKQSSDGDHMSPFMRLRTGAFNLRRVIPQRRIRRSKMHLIGQVDPAHAQAYEDSCNRTRASIPFLSHKLVTPEGYREPLFCLYCGQKFQNHTAVREHEQRHEYLHNSKMFRHYGTTLSRWAQLDPKSTTPQGKHIPRLTDTPPNM